MDEEPKNAFPAPPCKTCGPTNWNPEQTRRDLFKNATKAGAVLALTGSLLTRSSLPAYADPACEAICYDILVGCTSAARKLFTKKRRIIRRAFCLKQYRGCIQDCLELDLEEELSD